MGDTHRNKDIAINAYEIRRAPKCEGSSDLPTGRARMASISLTTWNSEVYEPSDVSCDARCPRRLA